MHLRPKNLGPIYIQIQMQDNYAIVNLASSNSYIYALLKHSLSSLKKSLIKNGVRISQINIDNSLSVDFMKTKKINNIYKNKKETSFLYKNQLEKFCSENNKNIKINKIDMYV